MNNHSELIKAKAFELGFNFFGITKPTKIIRFSAYKNWIKKKQYGNMDFLANPNNLAVREDPSILLPGCKSIFVVGLQYSKNTEINDFPIQGPSGKIASFAQGRDYHKIILENLDQLGLYIGSLFSDNHHSKAYCDSGPLLEKEIAQNTGIGWIGKNSLLISPLIGSSFNLGEMLTDLEFEYGQAVSFDNCGDCQKCIDACPTQCINTDRTIRADHCISYLSIENKGIIERELRPMMSNWVFGCDICQLVCPWNKNVLNTSPKLSALEEGEIDLLEEINLTRESFKEKYQNRSILRATWSGFVRNIVISLGNLHESKSITILQNFLFSNPNPILRIHAAWSIAKIDHKCGKVIIEKALINENDQRVIEEIKLSLLEN